MSNYFEYNNGKDVVPQGSFRVSASSISDFLDHTTSWWRQNLLGEEGFTGSTSTHLGTCVHAAAEMYVKTKEVDTKAIEDYILSITDPEVDKSYIFEQYPQMVEALINGYLSQHIPQVTEKFLYKEIIPGIGVGGSLDSIYGTTLVDYKTTSTKTPPKSFPRKYWFQQMTYVWLCKQHNININFMKLVYITAADVNRVSEKTGKPMKDYPSTVYELVEPVTDEGLQIIENTIKLVCNSVHLWKTNPEMQPYLAQDWRLHKPKPVLFK
jgi:hypothetical protein